MDISLTVLLTNKCNKNCSFCFVSKGQDDLTIEKFRDVFINIYENEERKYKGNNYSIVFMGGEPLINFEVLQEAFNILRKTVHSNHLRCRVVTNGILLSKYISWFRENKEIQIVLSLEDINQLEGFSPSDLTVRIIITPENIGVISEKIAAVAKLGFWVECIIADGVMWDILQHKKMIKNFYSKIVMFFTANLNLPPPNILSTALWRVHEEPKNCVPGINSFCIDSTGEVYGCNRLTPNSNHGRFKIIHNIDDPPYLIRGKCENCGVKNICSICPAVRASIYTTRQAEVKCLYIREAIFASIHYLSEIAIRCKKGEMLRKESFFLKERPSLSINHLVKWCLECGKIFQEYCE